MVAVVVAAAVAAATAVVVATNDDINPDSLDPLSQRTCFGQ